MTNTTNTATATHERRWIGRNRKIVTVVRFDDGREVVFCERMPKRAAIAQAKAVRA